MPDFDEDRFKADVTIPSEQQVERAAKLICMAHGRGVHEWVLYQDQARGALVIVMNQAKWKFGL